MKDERSQLWPGRESQSTVDSLLSGFRDPRRRLIAIAPGASLDRRRWPVASFARLASQLIAHSAAQIVIIGGSEDAALGDSLVAQTDSARHVLNLAGRLRLQESASLLGRCALFIGNDSGPMHMAAAMGVPCVEISCHPVNGDPAGSNSPVRFSPWGVPHRVLQPLHAIRPCDDGCAKSYAHCIKTIPVEQVLRAVQELLPVAESQAERSHEQHAV